jgi:hypothetical protein
MKKVVIAVFIIALFAILSIDSGYQATTKADNLLPQGSYGILLNGSVLLSPTTRADASLVGRLQIDNQGNVSGSRTLVIAGVGVIPGGDFTCTFTEANSDGTGILTCHVVDALTGPAGRDDSFKYVLIDNQKEIFLNLIGGVPGAVISGTAKKQ